MMLTRLNNGKTVSKQYAEMRQQGVIDRDRLSEEQKLWVDLGAGEGNGSFNELTYQADKDIAQGYFTRTLRVSSVDGTRGIIDIEGQGGLDGGHNTSKNVARH